MPWSPKFTIRPRLLRITREIGETLGAIRSNDMSERGLEGLALEARMLSTFASTSIEGNPLPLTDVKRLLKEAPRQIRDTEREILNYNDALETIYAQVAGGKLKLTTRSFERIQGKVVTDLMENRSDIGKLRQKPVVIRDPLKPDRIVFMPPDHGDVPALCDELMAYIRKNPDELDPILLAGVFHKQAVIIHPFMDGNGRSTRLMTTAILGHEGLDIFPIFSFEAYYNRNVTRYFRMVGETGDYYDLKDQIDFTDWLEYFAEGILDELKRVQKTLPRTVQRLEDHHRIILDFLDTNDTITQREYGKLSARSLAARKADFNYLLNLGLIERHGSGRSVWYSKL